MTTTNMTKARDNVWEVDGVMEVDNSSSEELSPPLPESANAASKNFTTEEYIQFLEKLYEQNPSDTETMGRLIDALSMELEKEDAKLLLLQKIWLNQNPATTSNGAQVNGAPTPQNGSLSATDAFQRQQPAGVGRRQQSKHSSSTTGPTNATPSTTVPQPNTTSGIGSSGSLSSSHTSATNLISSSSTVTSNVNVPDAVTNSLPKLASSVALQTLEQQTLSKRNELRRSAEEAMLAIPLPNPHAPLGSSLGWGDTITFIPNAMSTEFIYLYGLEEVVNKIQEYDLVAAGQPVSTGCNYPPFVCCECGTDFTPQWKRKVDVLAQNGVSKSTPDTDSASTTDVLCEACVSQVQRQRLRQEYSKKIHDISVDELVKEREIEADFKRIRTTPSEFEKYRLEQEKKMQAQHLATYGNRGISGSSGMSSSAGLIGTSTNNLMGLNPNASRRTNHVANTMQHQQQQSQHTSQQQRQMTTSNTGNSGGQMSNVYGLNLRGNNTPRVAGLTSTSTSNANNSSITGSRRSSNLPTSNPNPNVLGLNHTRGSGTTSGSNAVNSSSVNQQRSSTGTSNRSGLSSTSAQSQQQQQVLNSLNLTGQSTSNAAVNLGGGNTASSLGLDLNQQLNMGLLAGGISTDLQMILLHSLLSQNPVAATLLAHNLQQQQLQQQQQQQARSNSSNLNQSLNQFLTMYLQQQQNQSQSKGHK